ncbi:unnamed protein product [Aureobasidium uvarum]|uniref:Uncharacterized protein n=1 Tax=Aureobasidium uvarum TaxID=2773716 RepID=A0A9N8KQA0_9PEZI|nr:unnamed protein product [Aureobasidium uvarum]
MHLHNRATTHDLDYLLNARTFGRRFQAVKEELRRLISRVARTLNYEDEWANDEVSTFLNYLSDPQILFDDSKRQGIIVYQNDCLVIYAVKWEWVLSRKLKRIQRPHREPKPQDWLDCISIASLLFRRNGHKLSPIILKRYDNAQREIPVLPETVAELKSRVQRLTNLETFPGTVWVYTRRGFHYQWTTGELIPHNLWPLVRGIKNVYVGDQRRWRMYDFGKSPVVMGAQVGRSPLNAMKASL